MNRFPLVKPTLLILSLFLVAGCASKSMLISTGPPKKRIEAPYKKVPESEQVSPTQKPYRIGGRTYYPLPSSQGYEEVGIASWYGGDFHGKKTSNGEIYDMNGLTAAHKTLPMGTWLLVTNLENNKEITVRVNDRGPFVKERIIDLSRTAARDLGYLGNGTARVRITALGEAEAYRYGGVTTERFKTHPDFQSGEFYVQIGSFTVENNASRLKDRMLASGRKTLIRRFESGNRLFFRVQVRAGRNLPAAREVEKSLEGSGFTEAFVVAQ